MELPWMQQIGRPPERKRIPVVLTVQEVQTLLSHMAGTEALLAALLYGSGLRLREALGLRVKDVDFDRHAIIVRSGKGDKDRVVMLPRALVPRLRAQLIQVRAVGAGPCHGARRRVSASCTGAQVPQGGRELGLVLGVSIGQAVCQDPQTGVERRHHLFEERLNRQLKSGSSGWHCQTRICPHPAPLIRHPLAASRHRHPNGARVVGAFGREHDDDLHACAESRCRRHLQPAGRLGLALVARLNDGCGAFIWMAAQGRHRLSDRCRTKQRPVPSRHHLCG